jgi:LmbE family N-acetylglucosaminyl deacetylase
MAFVNLNPIPKSVLAIGAHPDDVEFNCFGTLAKWSKFGSNIQIAIMTDGSKGTWNENEDLKQLVKTRKKEQISAAELIGSSVYFLDYVDGELEHKRSTVEQVTKLIRQTKPEVIITHDPFKKYRLHPDHRNCGMIVFDAVVAARDPHFFKELNLKHHRSNKMLLFEQEETDHLEVISDYIEIKVNALLKHVSQYESTMDITDAKDVQQIDKFYKWIQEIANSAGSSIKQPAESFKLIENI